MLPHCPTCYWCDAAHCFTSPTCQMDTRSTTTACSMWSRLATSTDIPSQARTGGPPSRRSSSSTASSSRSMTRASSRCRRRTTSSTSSCMWTTSSTSRLEAQPCVQHGRPPSVPASHGLTSARTCTTSSRCMYVNHLVASSWTWTSTSRHAWPKPSLEEFIMRMHGPQSLNLLTLSTARG